MSSATAGGEQHINDSSVALSGAPRDDEPARVPEQQDAGEPARRRGLRRMLAVVLVLVAAFAVVVLSPRSAHEPSAPPVQPSPAGAGFSTPPASPASS